jgi:glucose/arabinose dehydrogenase
VLKKKILNTKDKFKYSSVILRAKLDDNLDFLRFSIFFQTSETIEAYTPDLSHGGGRMVNYKDKKLLFIIPEYGHEELSQNSISIYGKSILIKINDPYDYEIFTSGHRNSQGLLYDKEKDIIINSEHGPMGGDELNILIKGQNYGWPLTYFGTNGRDVIAKDHSNLNFTKPIFIWNDNPGSSQIIKCKDNEYFLSSLSGIRGKQIYRFTIKDNKASITDSIYIGDRVRDLIYLKQKNLLIGVIENSKNIFKINLESVCK